MKRIYNFSAKTSLVLVLFTIFLTGYSDAIGQTQIKATIPFQSNGLASGRYTIFLKTTGNTTQLTKPIIIIEGIDFFEQFPALATTEDVILDLLNKPESHNLSNRLRSQGFDVVILNWGNSGDFLQKNAFLVVELIEEVNRLKALAGSTEPNVLVGISMGGLVSRYALSWMEKNGRTHNVRQFISYDSPQAGANFPLGLQFWAQSFGAFNTSVLNLAELAGVRSFNSESSKQMLKFHLTGVKSVNGMNVIEPISNHTNFFNEIEALNNNLGYPLNCQNIAISNGSKKGIGFLNSGVAFGYDLAPATSGFVSDLPITPPSNPSALFGQFNPLGSSGFNLAPVSLQQDYDNAPGGFINWYAVIVTGMTSQGFSASVRPNQENVTFIPTHSALGLKDPNLFRSLTTWQNHELQIPFDRYYSPQLVNQFHVALPTVTANWLYLQITSPNLWNINNVASRFNFGVNTNDFIFNNVNVSNGGILGINTNRQTDAYEFNNTFATQQPFPTLGSNNSFSVQTSSKRPVTITIANNGLLELGSGSGQTNGILRIKTGSTLRLIAGSSLSQMSNSRIEIESGGRMIIDAGANINLASTMAQIIVKNGGELIINGQFNFTGSGHFRFEQGNIFTLNSNLLLRGSARANPLIKIANGATVTVTNPFELRIENGTIYRESGNLASQRHIWLKNGATFFADNVVFDGQSAVLDPATFVEVNDPFDTGNDPDDIDYSFVNCRFQNTRGAVKLYVPDAIATIFDWRNINVQFLGCEFVNCQALKAERGYYTFFDNCTLTNSNIDVAHTYWLNVRNTSIRSTFGSGTAIKGSHLGHFWFRENCLIDNWGTGIDLTNGLNWNLIMTDGSTIQQCGIGINLNGSVFNSSVDLGILHMDCARMIQNGTAVNGRDIIFSAYMRGSNFNTFTKSPNNPNGRYIESVFDKRFESDLWFHGNFWDGITPDPTPVNTSWSFLTQPIPQGQTPWNGTFHLDNTRTDANNAVCGGLQLRGEKEDPFSKKTIVKINGVYRDVKVQYDAAFKHMKEKKLKKTLDGLVAIAQIPRNVRDTASPVVKHFVDIARAMTLKIGVGTRSASNDWLPESRVDVLQNFDSTPLVLYPNPANNTVQMTLTNGDYHLSVTNALGKMIFGQNTEGTLSVNTTTWTNGIYLFEVTDKATNKRQHSKIVVQH